MNAAVPGMRNRWLVLVAMTGSPSMVMLDQTKVMLAGSTLRSRQRTRGNPAAGRHSLTMGG